MKKLLVLLLALSSVVACGFAFAEKNTFVDTVRFIQYLDENTALEEVRNGSLDIYYFTIPSDRLEGSNARDGLQVYDSTGGSYSMLVNPAESEKFNPFSIQQVRFALNYLIDRKLIVNELMGGFGSATVSYYGPHDPEYLTIIERLESFNFKYNPKLAEELISEAMLAEGAIMQDGRWMYEDMPVEIRIFIRSDDPVRKSIGEILSSRLEHAGFAVSKDFGDLNKAFVVVYGSDPGQLQWNLYTEGWARSAFVRYDSVGLGQMYSPWFSNMPGFNDPGYWNYEHDELDSITQRIYTGDFESRSERAELIRDAVSLGVEESVRIFLASRIDQYVATDGIAGVVNDFGAGVPSRFTPINARTDDGSLTIGVKQIYQGAWNPVMGLSDSYSNHIWGIIADPSAFKHPFTGETFPVRSSWIVETGGPGGGIALPADAVMWDVESQSWGAVPANATATSRVTFDMRFSDWHHGQKMDMTDVLYSLYFLVEWGTHTAEDDRTFDTEFTPRAAQVMDTLVGIRQLDADTVEVYVDYWHFDDAEIAGWASLWSVVPWEISAAMEAAVMDGKVSFSRSGATSKNVNWLSLIVPNDAQLLLGYLEKFRAERHVPGALTGMDPVHASDRYGASIAWISDRNHAVISNGPFHLESYSPESRTITVRASADAGYPFAAGHWSDFETVRYPTINSVRIPDAIEKGTEVDIGVRAADSTEVLYFLTGMDGRLFSSSVAAHDGAETILTIPASETAMLRTGAADIKIFAVSQDVLRPDYYTTGFFVLDDMGPLPVPEISDAALETDSAGMLWLLAPILACIGILASVAYAKQRSSG